MPPTAPSAAPPSSPSVNLRGRFAARAVDYVLVFLFALGAVCCAAAVASFVPESNRATDIIAGTVVAFLFLWWGLLLFLYDWVFLRCWGATFGKMLVGIKVVDARGHGPLSNRKAAGRTAFFGLPQTIPLLGNLAALLESLAARTDPRGQALHDQSAGTLVVRARK
ncbi:RDD family protein [Nocardiopsis sp. NPDC050513]|uniref:RDD family protein n=1 Tax=Nocardiopsis sp. NPDC050513 TaxID=3364338 RepID=UPI0037B3FD0C